MVKSREAVVTAPCESWTLTFNVCDEPEGKYVPAGSVKKGEELVTTGGGKTTPCGICHGPDLHGLGPMPPLAGRTPSYIVRQIYDMQVNARKGEWVQLMKPVVEKLNDDDLIAIGAYVASLQ